MQARSAKTLAVFFYAVISLNLAFSQSSPRPIPATYSHGIKINYVRTWDVVAPTSNANEIHITTPNDQARMTTTYLDGLGRPIQVVQKQSSPSGKDMVIATQYDEFGRVQFQYLPFAASTTGGNTSVSDGLFKLNPFQQQADFYNSSNLLSPITGQGENFFYSQSVYEKSPLNRLEKALAPGNNWIGSDRGIIQKHWLNKEEDDVRIWIVENNANDFGSYSTNSVYDPGTLFKSVIEDEHGKQVIEFKDKEGRTVLKKVQLSDIYNSQSVKDDGTGKGYEGWLCTYYIYDDLGQLRCVIQPKGVELLLQNSWNIAALNNDILNEQCFRYEYDKKGRMIKKKVPGAGDVFMIYDSRDRLVLTQDANLRQDNKWLFTKYDQLNRPIMTGFYTNTTYPGQSAMQAYMDAQNMGLSEDFQSGTFPFYSQNNSFPVITNFNEQVLTITYYDNYSWASWFGSYDTKDNSMDGFFDSPSSSFPEPLIQSTATKGMVTGTWEKSGAITTIFYDEKGRVIQTKHKNITGGMDITTTQYSFSGQVLESIYKQDKGGDNPQTQRVYTKYSYDDVGRLHETKKKVESNLFPSSQLKTIASLFYDELGRLKEKKLAPEYNSGQGLEILKYDYNIRGWMMGANREYVKSTSSTSHYFGFDLGYDNTIIGTIGSYVSGQYNGNISGMLWKSTGDDEIRKYDFIYDAVNRLTGADFNQYTASSFNKQAGLDFSVSNLSYDANGNILGMQQKGWKVGGSMVIDELQYNYFINSNRLKNVIDDQNLTDTRLGDFRSSELYMTSLSNSKSADDIDYTYDLNGNLVKDLNKDIEDFEEFNGIEYNHLNLPVKIIIKKSDNANKGTIEYIYSAEGIKLKKIVSEKNVTIPYNGNNYYSDVITSTLYLGGFVYESKAYSNSALSSMAYNDKLQFLAHEEGRIRPTEDINEPFVYDYFLKDHLGNVRMMLTEEQKIDAYEILTFEDLNINQQNAQWENNQGQSIDVSGVRSVKDIGTGSSNNAMLVRSGSSNGSVGATQLLKVMAGDRIHTSVEYYYNLVDADNPQNVGFNSIIGSLVGNLTNSNLPSNILKGFESTINTELLSNSDLSSFLNQPPSQSGNNEAPKAYLCILFFNEQMKFDQESSQVIPVAYLTNNDYGKIDKTFSNAIEAKKNGYAFVYFANETDELVWFDNFYLSHQRSQLLEETHYYPFGLVMSGIGSRSLNFGNPESQKFKFNGIEQNTDFDLNLYESFYRNLDPQIGRWWGIDPKPRHNISPYAAMNNNPVSLVDFLGDTTYYYSNSGQLLSVVNDRSRTNYVKVDQNAWQLAYNPAIAGKDLSDQNIADGVVSSVNGTMLGWEKDYNQNYIAFGTGEMSIEYTGSMESTTELLGRQPGKAQSDYANGQLNVNLGFDDGVTLKIMGIDAKSGPWDYGAIPNGNYTVSGVVNTSEGGMVRDGVGFKVFLNDNIQYNRTQLRIHPDQSPAGTAGCIGLSCGREQLRQFRATVAGYLNNHNTMSVNVNITNNPNYSRPVGGRSTSGQ